MRAHGDRTTSSGAAHRACAARVAGALGAVVLAFGSGCRAPAEARGDEARIVYDPFRIPHILADDDRSALYALGFQQASDFPVATLANLWSATGRFAHVAGKAVLERDARIRRFGIDAKAAKQARDPNELAPDVRALLVAYVDGVNAGRRAWLTDAEAFETLLGEDAEGPTRGPSLAFDPVPPWLDPVFADDDLRARLRRLFDAEITLEHVLSLGIAVNGGPEFIGGGYATRTNIWTVRNAERDPAVVTMVDSHQPIRASGARAYFVQVAGDTYDVVGYSYPGFPCVTLGFNDTLAFSLQTLPSPPRPLSVLGATAFRYRGNDAPHVARWDAELVPNAERLLVGDASVALESTSTVLRYWDVARGELVDDPRGARTFAFVPETNAELARFALRYPVLDDTANPASNGRTIRFEGRSFLAARSPWEFWIGVGRARGIARADGGSSADDEHTLEALLERSILCMGRGEALVVSDARGGLEYLSLGLVPIPGIAASGGGTLDGNDPAQRWRGFHAFDELPRIVDTDGYGERAEAWVQSNGSPHVLRRAGFDARAFAARPYLLDPEPWKSLRHDRAFELVERAAEDGAASLDELCAAALDVQDVWSARMWPFVAEVESADSADFLAWLDTWRFEGADGSPGDEAFLAHPMSQVTVFMTLVRSEFEGAVLELDAPTADELGFAFDPSFALPTPELVRSSSEWRRIGRALTGAVQTSAALFEATRVGTGLVNARRLPALLGATVDDPVWARLFESTPDAWGTGRSAPLARWGWTNVLALTPHARRTPRANTLERSLRSMFAPADLAPFAFHSAQEPVVFPLGGVQDSIFQVHANGYRSSSDAVHATADGPLYLAPIDFGSQILYAVELRPNRPPAARFLASLGSTEITAPIASRGVAAGDHARNVEDFVAGHWNELITDEERVLDSAVRTVRLKRP